MRSRSYLLLEREYQELQEARLYGISVTPISDNLMKWIVQMQGLKDSLWEGALLQLTMTYTEEYNHRPPSIIFNTIPFHPNVDQTSGKPCIDFLDDPGGWNPAYTMTYVLLMIQAMLSNPVLENAVNPDAANMALNKAALYRQMVLNCVKTSRQIEDGSIPESVVIRTTPAPTFTPAPRKIKTVSFENYHKTWREIATSKTGQNLKNKKYRELESRIFSREKEEMKRGIKTYSFIIHGLLSDRIRTFPSLREADARRCALCRLSESHLLGSIADVESETERHSDRKHQTDDTVASYRKSARNPEPLEEEVDDLVAWTNSLSTDLLED
ncbi:ubiquitin-conjugating enzyme E2 U isoform X2 [Phyllobates terribilis]|uniref:ubiquitin-conjugating enzyme E2 U isoform X2 n=1 Tax=Phyllobates terribilis TaxID=111132 RepID=UPI003CCB368E